MKKTVNNAKYEKLSQHFYKDVETDSTSLIVNSEDQGSDIMWLSTGDASTLGAEEVAARLRVETRQGLSWQEATHRRQLSG
ncbi:hypothetical protein ILUMI_07399 [Ignelater luminosus]|uniref:Uncharacterized protein n=1 Tax=Ignelater luminosus TaxID=2038154 RepID=A0A8K0D8E0_IGNLU|nr:hypothetical protein ILUMI_07399 [Ignelater luminosus]